MRVHLSVVFFVLACVPPSCPSPTCPPDGPSANHISVLGCGFSPLSFTTLSGDDLTFNGNSLSIPAGGRWSFDIPGFVVGEKNSVAMTIRKPDPNTWSLYTGVLGIGASDGTILVQITWRFYYNGAQVTVWPGGAGFSTSLQPSEWFTMNLEFTPSQVRCYLSGVAPDNLFRSYADTLRSYSIPLGSSPTFYLGGEKDTKLVSNVPIEIGAIWYSNAPLGNPDGAIMQNLPGNAQRHPYLPYPLEVCDSTMCSGPGCDAGYYGPSGGPCSQCPDNFYSESTGSDACTACPYDSSTLTLPGSTTISACKCNQGYTGELTLASDTCSACESNNYKDTTGSDACTACPAGSSTEGNVGAVSASDCTCNAGYNYAMQYEYTHLQLWYCYGAVTIMNGEKPSFHGGLEGCKEVCNSLGDNCMAFTYYIIGGMSGKCEFHGVGYGNFKYYSDRDCYQKGAGTLSATCEACGAGFAKPAPGPGPCYECAGRDAFSTSINPTASEECTCIAGHYWDGAACKHCRATSYKDNAGNESTCTQIDPSEPCCMCKPDATTLAVGSTDVAECLCIAGFEAATATDDCAACAVGKYKTDAGHGPCTMCAVGGTTEITGSVSIDSCVALPGYVVSGPAFQECPVDTYQPVLGGTLCNPCPLGASSSIASTDVAACACQAALGYVASKSGAGLAYCVCDAGYYELADGTCEQCPQGKFCPGSYAGYVSLNDSGDALTGTAVDCPADSSTAQSGVTTSAACVCDAGYTEVTGSSTSRRLLVVSCEACQPGTYKVDVGNEVCLPCPDHSSSPAASITVTACFCAAGYTGPDGGECTMCAPGSYKAFSGSSPCTLCPSNASSPSASTDALHCLCNAGYTNPDADECAACAPGFYKSTAGSSPCTPCAAHTSSPSASSDESHCLCNVGYTGPDGGQCSPCDMLSYKDTIGSAACLSCHANSAVLYDANSHTMTYAGTMQYDSEPVISVQCSPQTPLHSGTCDAVTGPEISSSNTIVSGTYNNFFLDLTSTESHRLRKIAIKTSTFGRWTFYSGEAVCKYFVVDTTDVVEIDAFFCPVSSYFQLRHSRESDNDDPISLHAIVLYDMTYSCTCNKGYAATDGRCDPCPANSWKDWNGDNACTACPDNSMQLGEPTENNVCKCLPGYTWSRNTYDVLICSGCGVDTYKDVYGGGYCTSCPADSSAPALSDAAGDCECNAGYTGSNGGVCSPCLAGTYKHVTGSAACAACPTASSSPAASDALADCVCNAGYTGNDGEACPACAAGTFKSATGSAACDACPDHSSSPTASDAQTDCFCKAGYTGANGAPCTACPANTFKSETGSEACQNCSAHATAPAASTAATACVCDPGYAGGHGTPCTQCVAGTYEDPAQHSCRLCGSHSSSPEGSDAQTDCTCNAGYQGPDGGTCNACLENSFKNSTGSAACTACTKFSTSESASDSADDCECIGGYLKTGDGSCGLVCAAGYEMSVDQTDCLPCPNSYYKTEAGEHMCARCPAHAMHGLTAQTSVDACYCEQGYLWDSATKTCVMCPAGSFNNRANESQCFDCVQDGTSVEYQKNLNTLCWGARYGILTDAIVTDQQLIDTICKPTCLETPGCVGFNYYKAPHGYKNRCWYVLEWRGDRTSYGDRDCYELIVVPAEAGTSTQCPGLTQAPAGYQATTSGANLELCPVNHYNDGSLLKCAPCPSPTSFSSLGGLTSASQCECVSGFSRVAGVCESCPIGTFKHGMGDGPCVQCPVHSTTASIEGLDLSACRCLPTFEPDNVIKTCQGYYGVTEIESTTRLDPEFLWYCIDCDCKLSSEAMSLEQLSASDQYCRVCGEHQFKHILGMQMCVACPPNSTLPLNQQHSSSSCHCDPGFSGDAGHTVNALCTACPTGSYKSSFGSAPCTSCGDNTDTDSDASTAKGECFCALLYEDGPDGGPHTGGSCVSSCLAGETGGRGSCAKCNVGKFKANRGGDACTGCPPPRSASRPGSTNEGSCSCPRKQMGLTPNKFHAIDSVGKFSEQDVQRRVVESGTVVAADAASRHKQLLVSGMEGASMQVYIEGRKIFECEVRECMQVSRVALFGSAGALLVNVLVEGGGVPRVELERYTRREVTVTQPPTWWDQAEVERLALSRGMRDGDYVFNTRTPFSAEHCIPCPRKLRCGDFI